MVNLLSCKALPKFQGAAIHFERRGEKLSVLTIWESRVLVKLWANLKLLKLQDLNIQWNDSWSNSYSFAFGLVTNRLGSGAPREWHTASL